MTEEQQKRAQETATARSSEPLDDGWSAKISPAMAAQMERAPSEGLRRQFLADAEEQRRVEGFTEDPVGDTAAERSPLLLVKYSGRALLITTTECAAHCRFCFRKAQNREREPVTQAARLAAVASLADMPHIHEIIFSGGDPLILPNRALAPLFDTAARTPHIARIRIHTRMVSVAPERIDARLCRLLAAVGKPCIVVTHINHPDELGDAARRAARRLKRIDNVTLLNQSVLLMGVNDDVETLIALSEALVETGIIPYYLHQLDRVTGAHHFEVEAARGHALIAEMRARCPGYMVPRYVREIAGALSKTPLS